MTGCGAFSQGNFFHSKFPEFILKQNLHINALELLTVMATVKLWGRLWRGQKIVINCDNTTSCRVLNSGFSRDTFLQSCLREICFYVAVYEFQIRAKEISGSQNILPDYLSRWNESPRNRDLFYSSVANCTITQ